MSTYPACDPADGGMYAWVADDKYDMEEHLDRNYRKHLDKQVNKLLLRIRMLFYINYEVLDGIRDRCRASDIKARSSKDDWTGAFENPECPGNVLTLQPGEKTRIVSHKSYGKKSYPDNYMVS